MNSSVPEHAVKYIGYFRNLEEENPITLHLVDSSTIRTFLRGNIVTQLQYERLLMAMLYYIRNLHLYIVSPSYRDEPAAPTMHVNDKCQLIDGASRNKVSRSAYE